MQPVLSAVGRLLLWSDILVLTESASGLDLLAAPAAQYNAARKLCRRRLMACHLACAACAVVIWQDNVAESDVVTEMW